MSTTVPLSSELEPQPIEANGQQLVVPPSVESVVNGLVHDTGEVLAEGSIAWREASAFIVSKGISKFLFEVVDEETCLVTDVFSGHVASASKHYVRIDRCEGRPASDQIHVGEPLFVEGISRKTKKFDPNERYRIDVIEHIIHTRND